MDTGRSVDIVYLDFTKAFVKVPIRRLLAKVLASKETFWLGLSSGSLAGNKGWF